jgi:hypothetical protein
VSPPVPKSGYVPHAHYKVPRGQPLALLIVVVAVLAQHIVTSIVHLAALAPEVCARVTLVEVSKQQQETK